MKKLTAFDQFSTNQPTKLDIVISSGSIDRLSASIVRESRPILASWFHTWIAIRFCWVLLPVNTLVAIRGGAFKINSPSPMLLEQGYT
jgi:hypothetical protein